MLVTRKKHCPAESSIVQLVIRVEVEIMIAVPDSPLQHLSEVNGIRIVP